MAPCICIQPILLGCYRHRPHPHPSLKPTGSILLACASNASPTATSIHVSALSICTILDVFPTLPDSLDRFRVRVPGKTPGPPAQLPLTSNPNRFATRVSPLKFSCFTPGPRTPHGSTLLQSLVHPPATLWRRVWPPPSDLVSLPAPSPPCSPRPAPPPPAPTGVLAFAPPPPAPTGVLALATLACCYCLPLSHRLRQFSSFAGGPATSHRSALRLSALVPNRLGRGAAGAAPRNAGRGARREPRRHACYP